MSSPKVVSLGTMLVEIMRVALDEPFEQIGTFAGPFPSGDTPVYVNAVARLGHAAGFIGAVGQDGFGRCILNRFAEQGVDATHVRVLPDRTRGIAFVAYASDRTRRLHPAQRRRGDADAGDGGRRSGVPAAGGAGQGFTK